ncbi:unnamed protein product [Heligmosomoides polygyrus]|uniref:Glyco_hydro_32C domain-containing protein n=1 Tax=Heligmosomoides polygyrus TaxID=6339 RepID=A0A183GUJ5_HELPZ|nr:unnamed protein product [Heligmosomoides polygyrus]
MVHEVVVFLVDVAHDGIFAKAGKRDIAPSICSGRVTSSVVGASPESKGVDGSDVVKDAHFICESEISIIGDHENEKFMSNLSGNLENFEDVSKGGSPDLGDGATRAVVLDLAPDPKGGGSLFECFSYDEKRVIMISTNVGLCRSWRIRFWVTAIEPDGVHEVQVQSDNIDASQSADVVLGRDGVVRVSVLFSPYCFTADRTL